MVPNVINNEWRCAIAYLLHATTDVKITLGLGFVPQAQKEIEFREIIIPWSFAWSYKCVRVYMWLKCIADAPSVPLISIPVKSLGKISV